MTDNGFALWERAGITTLKDLFERDRMMSFDQLRLKYMISHMHFFRFQQVRSFIQDPTRHKFTLEMSPIDQLLYKLEHVQFWVQLWVGGGRSFKRGEKCVYKKEKRKCYICE